MLLKIIESVKKRIKVIKKNKAFTLTELIAVIVILSILITLSVVVFMNIRRNTLEKEYTNLVSYLETKAALYAKDTGITTISVEDLIKEGYIKPDDETDIYDPRDNTSMNCYTLIMEYKDEEYVAKLSDDLKRDENGKCNLYTKTFEYEICRINGNNCYSIDADEWFNKNIKLGIKDVNGLINRVDASYSWSTNTGFISNDKDVTTEVSLIGDITYKCEVKMKDETGKDIVGVATKNIKIDMEKPIISEIKYDTNWSLSKTIEVIATDGMGSGIKGYAIVKEDQDCSKYKAKNTVDINSNGNYKVCVKDKAGNITKKVIEVTSIDVVPGNPVISASDGIASGKYHSSNYTLSWKSDYDGTQDLIYYYGTNKNNLISKGASIVARKNQYNVTMYVKACTNGSNLCSGISSYVINVDTTPTNPVISASDGIASGKYHSSNYTLSWKSTNKGSQNLTYYYGTNASKMTSTGTSMSVNMNQYGVYVYVKACTAYSKCSGISKYLLNLDTKAPVINITSSNDGRNYFKFTATITDSQSGIVAYAITGYETPQNWISVSNTKSLNVSRDISWKEFGTYYIFAKDAMGNESKVERFLVVDRDYPNIVDHEVFYDCSTGKMYVGARILASASQYTWYYTSTNKNKPSLNASGWSLGCTNISKYNGTCSGSRLSLNRYGDTYVWAKACNSYNECTITPIGHAVCSNRQNTGGITYDSNMGHCYRGWITYDINTDKYSCIDRWSHAQNIADKNLEVPCAENGWARKFVPVSGTNYCCPEGFYINKNYKMGNYYACENNYGAPTCLRGAKLSANNGYCT